MLTLKRTYESRPVGPSSYEDYDVFDADQRVGRVMRHPQGPEERPWFWPIGARWPQSMHDCGYAVSRKQAMADFKARLHPH